MRIRLNIVRRTGFIPTWIIGTWLIIVDEITCATVEKADNETAGLDFKAAFDPKAAQDWCELIKDVVAMANSGGGIVVFGINDDFKRFFSDLLFPDQFLCVHRYDILS